MRTLLVFCFIAVAFASPQYNYQQPQVAQAPAPVAQIAPVAQPQQIHQSAPIAQSAPIPQSAPIAPASSIPQPSRQAAPAGPAVWNKQYFIHAAPEDEGLEGSSSNLDQSSFKRNLRVVIVKAPENKGLADAALQLAKSASEDKTAIYVLNKQTDLGELQNRLSQLQDINGNKPEVHFVKYKTPEEAQYAQQSIQSQYDQTYQGPTQVSNEGVAPVQNFVGSAGSSLGGGAGASLGGGFGGGNGFQGAQTQQAYQGVAAQQADNYATVNNQYLPAGRF